VVPAAAPRFCVIVATSTSDAPARLADPGRLTMIVRRNTSNFMIGTFKTTVGKPTLTFGVGYRTTGGAKGTVTIDGSLQTSGFSLQATNPDFFYVGSKRKREERNQIARAHAP
jgi:hypothetical protein